MNRWIVIYARVTDDKKKGVKVMGPYAGPICENEVDAKDAARKLVNESRNNSVIPKIYDMGATTYEAIFDEARPYFDRLKKNIIQAKSTMDKPVRKRKKKR